jgi:hypothetical protein
MDFLLTPSIVITHADIRLKLDVGKRSFVCSKMPEAGKRGESADIYRRILAQTDHSVRRKLTIRFSGNEKNELFKQIN